jgi:hypothetical protein
MHLRHRTLAGFHGYEVTEDGQVFSYRRGSKTLLRGVLNGSGYIQVRVVGPKGRALYLLHRMVAQAFVANPEGKPHVNHIDGDKRNNRAENLEWVTNKENIQHSWRIGLRCGNDGAKNGRAKLNEEQVAEIRELLSQGARQVDVAAQFGVGQAQVSRIARRESWPKVS